MRTAAGWPLVVILLLVALSIAIPATRAAAAQTGQRNPLVSEGIALHDKGLYDEAIAKYEEALKADPTDITALYEMAYTYCAKKDYKKAIELAEKGARVEGPFRSGFYLIIGNAKDDLGDSKGALKAYEDGIRANPDNGMLYFNLGVAQVNKRDLEEARRSFQRAVSLQPAHPGSHFWLGRVYATTGYRVPAFLALCRFLQLEPVSQRAKTAIAGLDELIGIGYSEAQGEDGKRQVNLTLNPNIKKDEGDFTGAEFGLLLARSTAGLEKATPEDKTLVGQLSHALLMIGEQKPGTGFAAEYYSAYFTALKEQSLVEPFVRVVMQSANVPGVREWLEKNPQAVAALDAWSKTYTWPTPKIR